MGDAPDYNLSRKAWYDRSPKVIFKVWGHSNLDPHAITQRWAYTVPTGRKAFLETAQVNIRRRVASTNDQYGQVYIYYTPSGEAGSVLLMAWIMSKAVGTNDKSVIGHSLLMFEGDQLAGYSGYSATGDGKTMIYVTAKLTEFDL